MLTPDAEQQLVVRARYSDDHTEDVTRWVKYSSSNEGVATVDDFGRVKMNGAGEAAVTLWYSSRVLYARLSVPSPTRSPPKSTARFPGAISSTSSCSPNGRTCASPRRKSPMMPRSSAALTSIPPASFPLPKRSRTSSPIPLPTSAPKSSIAFSSAMSSSITGRTSGPTCCWSRRRS